MIMNKSLSLHPDRKKKMKRPEQIIQIGVAKELYKLEAISKGEDFFFFHPANGGWRSPVEAGIMQAMGVRAGVSDLFLMFPGYDVCSQMSILNPSFLENLVAGPTLPHLVIVEFKAGKKSKLTDNQKDFARIMFRFGFEFNLVEAKDIQDGVVQTLRLMLPHLRPGCRTTEIIKKYIFPGGVRI